MRSIRSVDMVPAKGGCQVLNARCAGGALSGAVKPTGQAHHRVRLAEQIKPIDKDRRRSGKPQRLGLRVGVNHSEPNIDCGSTDGIEGMPQPLLGDRQAGAVLEEPDFNAHPSIMRLPAACRRDSGVCLVVGPLRATAADAALKNNHLAKIQVREIVFDRVGRLELEIVDAGVLAKEDMDGLARLVCTDDLVGCSRAASSVAVPRRALKTAITTSHVSTACRSTMSCAVPPSSGIACVSHRHGASCICSRSARELFQPARRIITRLQSSDQVHDPVADR